MGDAGAASPDAACPRCDRANRLAASYCGSCGAELPGDRLCPACGSPNPRRHRYCDMCGAALIAHTARAAPVRAGATQSTAAAPFALADPSSRSPLQRSSATPRSSDLYAGIFLVAAAAIPRFLRLDSIPGQVSAIEGLFASAASRMSQEGWIGLGPDVVAGEPAGFAYLLGAWSLLAGDSTLALRLFSAALGVASVVLFYLLTRRLLGMRPALFASAMLALSLWHLQFSRLVLPTTLMLAAVLAACALLTASLDEMRSAPRRRTLAVAAGVLVGVTPYIDSSFPILLAAVALFCLAQVALENEYAGEVSAALWIAAAIAALPYLFIAASNPGVALERVTGYSITASQEYQALQGIPEQTRYLAANVASMVGRVFFGALGGEPTWLLDAVTGILAVIGLLVSAVRWRERGHMLLMALFVVGVVLAGLTIEQGVYGRLVVAVPAALAAAGLGLHWALTWMEGRFSRRAVYGFAVLLIVLIAYMNLGAYFGDGPTTP